MTYDKNIFPVVSHDVGRTAPSVSLILDYFSRTAPSGFSRTESNTVMLGQNDSSGYDILKLLVILGYIIFKCLKRFQLRKGANIHIQKTNLRRIE